MLFVIDKHSVLIRKGTTDMPTCGVPFHEVNTSHVYYVYV